MSAADGEDLLDVVLAVNELESAPLIDPEWAEDHEAGASAGGAEDSFGFSEEQVEAGEMLGDSLGEGFAGERKVGMQWSDQRRGFATAWEVA